MTCMLMYEQQVEMDKLIKKERCWPQSNIQHCVHKEKGLFEVLIEVVQFTLKNGWHAASLVESTFPTSIRAA